MAIKINFTGAQGTGKTTVLNALREDPDFQGFEFVTEVVRNFVKETGLKINKEGTVETQMIIFGAYKKLLKKQNPFISDRCVVDVYAYTLEGLKAQTSESKEKSAFANCLYEQSKFISENIKELGLVFYFPIEFPLEDDSVRSLDVAYQKAIDQNIQAVLLDGIYHITVRGTVEERIAIIKKTLKEYL